MRNLDQTIFLLLTKLTFLLKPSFFSNVVVFNRFNCNLVCTQSLKSVFNEIELLVQTMEGSGRALKFERTEGTKFTFRNISHLDSIH